MGKDLKGKELGKGISQRKDGYVFLGRDGRPVTNTTYNRVLGQICEKAGIPRVTMHGLRHTFAARCAESGVSVKSLQYVMDLIPPRNY